MLFRRTIIEDMDKRRGDIADYRISLSFQSIGQAAAHARACGLKFARNPVGEMIEGNFFIAELLPAQWSSDTHALRFIGRDGYSTITKGFCFGSLDEALEAVDRHRDLLRDGKRQLLLAQDPYPWEYPPKANGGTIEWLEESRRKFQANFHAWLKLRQEISPQP